MIPRFTEDTIGHFWISFGLSFKASPGAHLFTWKLVFICMWMKTNFHVKGWAPRLALKKRPKVIRKWSIEVSFIMAVICRVCQNRGMCDHVWGLLSSSFFCWFFNTVSYHFCTNHPFMHVVCKLFPHHVSDGVGLSVIMLIIIIIIIIMFNISNNNNNV